MQLHRIICFVCLFSSVHSLSKTSAAARLRNLYSSEEKTKRETSAIVLPGVHDALSAKVYAKQGAKALFLSGFGVSATKLGEPDVGILTLTEMEDVVRSVVRSSGGVPVIVDGDTGYGGSINVRRTIRSFAAAGAAAVTIEDQAFPKKCTYAAGGSVRVVSREESLARVKAALSARDEALDQDGNSILVIARTDCRAALGLEEAVERCKMYEKAGADICYAENLQTREEYEHLRGELMSSTGTILAQVQTGDIEQTLFSAQTMGEMNYDFALFGITALQAYVKSLEASASLLMESNSSGLIEGGKPDLISFGDLKRNIGFEESERFLLEHDL